MVDAHSETQATASEGERRQMDGGEPLYGFRPLGLPALTAAAARARRTPPVRPSPRGQGRGILAIVHEDEPLA